MTKSKNKVVSAINLMYPPVILIVLLLVVWQTVCTANAISVWMLAKPTDIFTAFAANTKELLPDIWITYSNELIGYVLAIVIGLALAILLCAFPLVGAALNPFIIVVCCIPMISLVPTLMLVLGLGRSVKIITIVVQSFPIICMNASTGITNVDPTRLELMQSLKATKAEQFRYCILKDALPDIFTGLKLGAVMSMIGGVTAEMTGGNSGLGSRINYYIGFSKSSEALSCVIYIILLGAILYAVVSAIGAHLMKHH